jgi:hypothetical protein
MKKIIAISVMFALIAGAVFADTSIGGAVETRFSVAKQTGADGDAPKMGGSIGAAQLRFSGSNTEGTLGGLFRLRNTDIVRTIKPWVNNGVPASGNFGDWLGPWYHGVFVWWKPVEQVKIFLGIDNDGLFATGDFTEWGFHTGDNDYLFNHQWDFWRQVFPGNWDGFGLAFSFYPIPGLDINLALPTGGINWPQATAAQVGKDQWLSDSDAGNDGMLPGRLRFVANYSLDFGKISLVYIGGAAAAEKGTPENIGGFDNDNNGLFGLSVLVTAIEGIQIKVGGSVGLNTDSDMLINAGLGVAWAGDGFGVKFRAAMVQQGDGMFINGNVMPYFAVGEKGQVLIDIGVTNDGLTTAKRQDSAEMGWYVTPAYRLGIEDGAFKIGLQVYNNIKMGGNIALSGDEYVKWNIPMSLAFNF